jgi:hypothetical protein
MSNQRVAILDASHPLFEAQGRARDSGDESLKLCLQPIPQLQEIIRDTVKKTTESLSAGQSLGRVAMIGVGLVCTTRAVQILARGIHNRVLARLKSIPSK